MFCGKGQIRHTICISVLNKCSFLYDRLLAHVDDVSLDDEDSREYILYMCPAGGALCDSLEQFWAETELTAPNGAHESFPHIRLTTFFKVIAKMYILCCSNCSCFIYGYKFSLFHFMDTTICLINKLPAFQNNYMLCVPS